MRVIWTMLTFLLLTRVANGKTKTVNFSDKAWSEIAPIYSAILIHPFNRELAQGTLSQDRFLYYSVQDALYLPIFAKVLAILATKLEDARAMKQVLALATETLTVEKEQRESVQKPDKQELAPATLFYGNFLRATAAFGSREELAAALLPCFWIYLQLAKDLRQRVKPGNRFLWWFELYTSRAYQKSVAAMIQITDDLAERASIESRQKMLHAFVTASRLEWYFWEGAYTKKGWDP